jgi:hypothetical protein
LDGDYKMILAIGACRVGIERIERIKIEEQNRNAQYKVEI